MASEPQISYMQILFNDLGYDRMARQAWLSDTFQREIKYLDDITVKEASLVINMLKDQKEDK